MILVVAPTVRVENIDHGSVEIIRIIQREGPRRGRGDVMKTKQVSYTLETLPPQTEVQRRRLTELAAMPDETIDTSDIPELSEEMWGDGVRGRFYRPVKQQITARVDADVLDWLKAQGKGYQSRLNAILRREMLAAQKRARGA